MDRNKGQRDRADSNPEAEATDQGIVRDNRGQEQPADKNRAQKASRVNRGVDEPEKNK